VLFAQLPVAGHYFWDLFPGFIISGLGLAFVFIPMSIGALTGVRPADAGIASGLINTSQQIGGAVGVAAATTIATTFTNHYVNSHRGTTAFSAAALVHGFQIAFYVLAGTAAVGAVLARLLIEPQRSVAESRPEVDEPQVAVASQYTPLCHETVTSA
jgi:MFS family permease